MLGVLAHEVGDGPHRHRGGEALGLADDPVGHVAAVGPAADAQALVVDVARALDDLVERAHQVGVVHARPVTHDRAPEAFAVAVRTARVHVEDDKTHAREDLQLVEERPSVLGVRTAVDLHHGRMEAVRVEALRFEHPALELPTVRSGEVLLLRQRYEALVQPWVQVGDTCLRALREHVELAWVGRV